MSFLSRLGLWAQKVLLPLGPWGLLAATMLDSSFLALPGGVDIWLITLCALDAPRMPLYALAATVGSVVGSAVLYAVVRKGKQRFLEKERNDSRFSGVRQQVEKYGSAALVISAILPPPAPFKLVIVAAGLLEHPFDRFVLALLVGRSIRYFGEGWLGARYGRQAWDVLVASGPLVTGLVALAVILLLLMASLRRKASRASN